MGKPDAQIGRWFGDAASGCVKVCGCRPWGTAATPSVLHEFCISEDGGKRGSKLVAHVGHELTLVLAGDFEVLNCLGEITRPRLHLLEQPRVLDSDDGLIGERLEQLDLSI